MAPSAAMYNEISLTQRLTRYMVVLRTYTGDGLVSLDDNPNWQSRTHMIALYLDTTSVREEPGILTWHYEGFSNTFLPAGIKTPPRDLRVVSQCYVNYEEAVARMTELFGADPSTNLPILTNLMGTLSGEKGVQILSPTLEKVRRVGVLYGRQDVEAKWWNVVKVEFEVKEELGGNGMDEGEATDLKGRSWMRRMSVTGKK